MRACAIFILFCLFAASRDAFAYSNQQMEKRWMEITAIQIRNEATRAGVDMWHVVVSVDMKRRSVSLTGYVGTPWEEKTLLHVVKNSGVGDTVVNNLEVQFIPEQWQRLRASFRDEGTSAEDREKCRQLLKQYDELIRQYNGVVAKGGRNESQTRNDLRRLVKELDAVEAQIEECDAFWIDETVKQLQEYRAIKNAKAALASNTAPITATATNAPAAPKK
jgi:hypothetical protein